MATVWKRPITIWYDQRLTDSYLAALRVLGKINWMKENW